MTCTKIQVPGGGVAIVCTRGPRKRVVCVTCGKPAPLECDGCDRRICKACSISPREGLDYCVACQVPMKKWWLANDGATYALESKPLLLMRFLQWARSNWQRFPRTEWSRE